MTKPICGSAIVARPRRRKSAQTAIALGRGHHCDAGEPAAQDLVTKRKANATDITISGQSSEGAIVGPPRRKTEAGWCGMFHQSIENL
jgi:hypothetical protein